ncbi:ferredoxin-NADP reductase [Halopolyspora algeriensis]|uniref:Ferredoxin-NADP reductase n=1 Tax=Halopolyspora algeriensis TaxID=1500506 RepID=A0A368VEN4_9ACTN|nr:PDR/VanB family oxidoreductase [Halopolyspora algeriensis]RCW39659.1 ferredoxin-NADP reductase [Halopolyspora algeriensis]TQM54048.1 ferredoxin-NADP reductase [Halopolyspora algeriensis]
MSVLRARTRDVVVDRVERIAEDVVSLVLVNQDGSPFPAWEPGSHVDLHLGEEHVRQYSLCSSPTDLSHLRIAVLNVPDSRGGSTWVHENIRPGETVSISEPRNNFPIKDSRKYLFLAGGIGITPIIPMIEWAHAAGKEWQLIYGGRSRGSMAFGDRLREEYGDRVQLVPEDESGRMDLQAVLGLPRAHMLVYACGPTGMLRTVEDLCMGWPPGSLHTEKFAATALGTTSAAEPFDVDLVRSGKTVRVPTDRTILDAVEDVGVRVLSSCRHGLCGTCETTVLAGEPEHRDAVLPQEDRDSGDMMMICVSRAAAGCRRLALDL